MKYIFINTKTYLNPEDYDQKTESREVRIKVLYTV